MRNRIWMFLATGVVILAAAAGVARAQISRSVVDQQISTNVQTKLAKNKNLANVHSSVQDRLVTLTGTVPTYRAALEAEHDVKQVDNVHGVVNDLRVAGGPSVPDDQLQKQIADRLVYDRMGMGQTFNSFNIEVKNGVVTVAGQVRDYPDRDSALDIIDDTKGVRGVVDDIEVAPLSPTDDALRLEAARRIYGNPQLQRYALDPAKPIRIVVDNGNITLEGVVQSQLDKTLAGNAVRSMGGVFKVTNNLVVAH